MRKGFWFPPYKHKAGCCFANIKGEIVKMTFDSALAKLAHERKARLSFHFSLLTESVAEPRFAASESG